MPSIAHFRNDSTGELATAHCLGTDISGLPLYLNITDWTPVDIDGAPVEVDLDEDGNLTIARKRCECGAWSGTYCTRVYEPSETAVVEFMPPHLRTSHLVAGNGGVYPHNGSQRIRAERSCANRMVEEDPWCKIVKKS